MGNPAIVTEICSFWSHKNIHLLNSFAILLPKDVMILFQVLELGMTYFSRNADDKHPLSENGFSRRTKIRQNRSKIEQNAHLGAINF